MWFLRLTLAMKTMVSPSLYEYNTGTAFTDSSRLYKDKIYNNNNNNNHNTIIMHPL